MSAMDIRTRDQNNNMEQEDAPKFGIMFDIDGVLLRGKTPIPQASEALELLLDAKKEKFAVPTVFCTNGFGLREVKAATLSQKLGVEVNPDQIVMSQSPLEMFHEYHDKWCLVSGPEHDGGSVKVAQSLGFQKIVTIEDVRKAYPYLDWVDRARWPEEAVDDDHTFPVIEAVVLLGEPVRWETNLQLILDVLLTDGKPNKPATMQQQGKHIPVLAVNMDLLWMAKAQSPRFGHGAFLVCLENLFKKITGKDLEYMALIGKPSEITYEYSQKLIEEIATSLGISDLRTVYAIGDNPLTDIYGANMFTKFLKRKREELACRREIVEHQMESQLSSSPSNRFHKDGSAGSDEQLFRSVIASGHIALNGDITNVRGITKCTSILVRTGVYQSSDDSLKSTETDDDQEVDHGHRDLPYNPEMTRPDHIVDDVKCAINTIITAEKWRPYQEREAHCYQ